MPSSYSTLYLIFPSPQGHWHFHLNNHNSDSQSSSSSLAFCIFIENPDFNGYTMKRFIAEIRCSNQKTAMKNLSCQESSKTTLQQLAWQCVGNREN